MKARYSLSQFTSWGPHVRSRCMLGQKKSSYSEIQLLIESTMHVFGKLERKISCEMDAHALSVCRNFEAGVLIRSEYRFWKTVRSLLCVVSRSWIMCIKGFVMCIPMIETVHKIGFMISISKNALLRMEWWSHHLWYFDTYQDNPLCYLWDAQMRITITKSIEAVIFEW